MKIKDIKRVVYDRPNNIILSGRLSCKSNALFDLMTNLFLKLLRLKTSILRTSSEYTRKDFTRTASLDRMKNEKLENE